MLDASQFVEWLGSLKIEFFTGVPDSLLKEFCRCLDKRVPREHRVIAANEGGAVALATGYHIATGRIPLVYMQNSGLGNAVNPLLSLADPRVFAVPMLLLIGWRGEPRKHDEPQHIPQGECTLPLLDAMQIPYVILDKTAEIASAQLELIAKTAGHRSGPCAIVVRKGTFAPFPVTEEQPEAFPSREDVIDAVIRTIDSGDFVVCSTGMASRELYEIRERRGMTHDRDFLMVGSMGHASQIARGLAMNLTQNRVICLDGDGAALMQLGGFSGVGCDKLHNLTHLILNNASHDSVGGQPTVGRQIAWPKLGAALGYERTERVENVQELEAALTDRTAVCRIIEIPCRKGARADLGRPQGKPADEKKRMMELIYREKMK